MCFYIPIYIISIRVSKQRHRAISYYFQIIDNKIELGLNTSSDSEIHVITSIHYLSNNSVWNRNVHFLAYKALPEFYLWSLWRHLSFQEMPYFSWNLCFFLDYYTLSKQNWFGSLHHSGFLSVCVYKWFGQSIKYNFNIMYLLWYLTIYNCRTLVVKQIGKVHFPKSKVAIHCHILSREKSLQQRSWIIVISVVFQEKLMSWWSRIIPFYE